jgi:hypothetical protein
MAYGSINLTREILSQSGVIAKGRRIREVKRLVMQYGGRASRWVKKSGPRIDLGHRMIAYHWYEHPAIGRFEVREVQIHQP